MIDCYTYILYFVLKPRLPKGFIYFFPNYLCGRIKTSVVLMSTTERIHSIFSVMCDNNMSPEEEESSKQNKV